MLSRVLDAAAVKESFFHSHHYKASLGLRGEWATLCNSCKRRVSTSAAVAAKGLKNSTKTLSSSAKGYELPPLWFKARRRTLDVSAEQSGQHAVSADDGKAAAESDAADRKADELRAKLGIRSAVREPGTSLSSLRPLFPYLALACTVIAFRRTVLAELLNLVQVAVSATLSALDFAAVLVQLAWLPLSSALAPTKAGPYAERLGQMAAQLPYAIAASVWFSIDAAPVATILANMAASWLAVSLIKTVDSTDPWLSGIDIAGAAGLAAGLKFLPWPLMLAAFAAVGLFSHYVLGRDRLASSTPVFVTLLCIGTAPVKVLILAALAAMAVRSHGGKGAWTQLTGVGNGGFQHGALAHTAWLRGSLVARAFALMVAVALVGRGVLAFSVGDAVL